MKPKKSIRLAAAISLGMVAIYFITNSPDDSLVLFLPYVLGIIFFTLFFLRTQIWFKPFVLSKWNFISDRYEEIHEIDMETDILFDKFLEVLPTSGFTVRHFDRNKGEIFVTTGISFKSFGENIYFDLTAEGDKTQVKITSTTFFQAVSWGKNEQNIRQFIGQFDKSLVI